MGNGMLAATRRWTCSHLLGNECKALMSQIQVCWIWHLRGNGKWTAWVLEEQKLPCGIIEHCIVLQNITALPKEIANYISFCGSSSRDKHLWSDANSARFHRVPNLFLVQRLHKTSIEVCLKHLPLLFEALW